MSDVSERDVTVCPVCNLINERLRVESTMNGTMKMSGYFVSMVCSEQIKVKKPQVVRF